MACARRREAEGIVMASLLASFIGGLLLGLAGAVHCACMCGGIAMTALSISGAKTPGEKLRFLLRAQIGRIGVYMIAGGVLAGTADMTLNFASAGDAHHAIGGSSLHDVDRLISGGACSSLCVARPRNALAVSSVSCRRGLGIFCVPHGLCSLVFGVLDRNPHRRKRLDGRFWPWHNCARHTGSARTVSDDAL